MSEYFDGKRKQFDLPLKHFGTAFQTSILTSVRKITYGKTSSYGGIAKNIGIEKAVRAVGNANRMNKILIIIPCHRVIGSKGKLSTVK